MRRVSDEDTSLSDQSVVVERLNPGPIYCREDGSDFAIWVIWSTTER
jgi:hypothetical protein